MRTAGIIIGSVASLLATSVMAQQSNMGGRAAAIPLAFEALGAVAGASGLDSGIILQDVTTEDAVLQATGNIGGSQALNSISTAGAQLVTVQTAEGDSLRLQSTGNMNFNQAANYLESDTGVAAAYQGANFDQIELIATGNINSHQAVNRIEIGQ